jgi:ribosome recycling factor
MTKDVIKSAEDRLSKTLDALKKEYGTLRAGRAAPSLLDKVMVDYYGTATPVNQIANVTVPEPRMIMIKPYDRSSLREIERAIQKSDLGLTPNNDGTMIRLAIPQPTQERRKELVKIVSKKAEDAKVAMRNIRRDANEAIKKLEKGKEITEDDRKDAQEEMQKLLDKYIKLVDSARSAKEKEVMEV